MHDAYKSVYEAITHGGVANDCGVEIEKVEAEAIEKIGAEKMLKGLGGILVPGGFGERGIEGKIEAARYAREEGIPYLGLCLGMQIATIEFARNVLKLENAHSTEFNPDTPHPVIALLDEQKKITSKGGTMRLGRQPCQLVLGSQANRLYGAFIINERHRHRYEFNNDYHEAFAKAGFGLQRLLARRQAGGSDRIARPSLFPGLPVSPGVSEQTRPAAPVIQGLHRRRPRPPEPQDRAVRRSHAAGFGERACPPRAADRRPRRLMLRFRLDAMTGRI